jgi:hypothetical protein
MPRKNVDYSKTMMYKIVSNDLNIRDCYVGSTTEFTKRKCGHKTICTNINSKNYNLKLYQFIRDNGDLQNWSMILIEMFPCTNHLESLQRERFWCEHLNATLNSVVPSRTKQEYDKQHFQDNIEKIKHHKNTVSICQCGCSYTRSNKTSHERINKHKEYVENRLYYDIQRGLIMIKKLDAHFLNKYPKSTVSIRWSQLTVS